MRYREKLKQSSKRRKEGLPLVQDSPEDRSYDPLSVDEINKAEKEVLKFIQRQSFGEELSRLDEQEEVNESNDLKSAKERKPQIKKSSAIYRLDPMKLGGLLYVGGRLRQASISYPAKHQIILPNRHHVMDLLVCYFHLISGHSGLEHVLSMVQGEFWILKARTAVRRVVIDCFGLFLVQRGRSLVKKYGVLFTCLSIRAIHLKVSQSLDTDSFINAMWRFIARRGQPEEVRSDNGGNFVRGEKELQEEIEGWNQHKIGEFLLQQNVKWTFNPPDGSHHGGVWERCIRTVRKVISALTKEQILDKEGLVTLMCEVESIVNGRPVTKVSDNPKDLDTLTPNHLLLLHSGPSLPPGFFQKDEIYSRKRWRQIQYLAEVLWRRWIKEYLPSLQERQKCNRPMRNFVIGNIVLVADVNCPRSCWLPARIVDVQLNDKDGFVRRVTVKTKTSTLQRPIDKLILLESA